MARVVVITGGGTGIGAACARLMRAAGNRVFITGRREAPLQAVADETGATALVGDAADGEVWRQRLLPAILDQTGEAHEQSFRVCCDLAEIGICTQGQGGSRRAAEQQAAERALEALDAQARHNAPRKN